MLHVRRRLKLSLVLAIVAATSIGCATTQQGAPGRGGGPGGPGQRLPGQGPDPVSLYQRSGLMAVAAPVAFVGRFAFLAGAHTDSTLTLVSISLPSRSLSFTRESDTFRAGYTVVAELRSIAGSQRVIDAVESVRVLTYDETQSEDENIIFQKYFYAAPGVYELSVSVRDLSGSRTSTFENDFSVPDVTSRGISSIVTTYESSPRRALGALPRLTASPRGTAVFGRDSVISAYVETYGRDNTVPIMFEVRSDGGATLLRDSLVMAGNQRIAAASIAVPTAMVGIGGARILAWIPGTSDTVQAPVFVGFGEDLPAASFDEMLNYLRYFVNSERLSAMRSASPSEKPVLWSTFIAETDPDPTTSAHEALQEYFAKVRLANSRFREEVTPGWLTDRGEVLITLGEPDLVSSGSSTADMRIRARSMVWEYQRHSLRIVFQDRTGLGRWVLDGQSRAQFNSVARRVRGT